MFLTDAGLRMPVEALFHDSVDAVHLGVRTLRSRQGEMKHEKSNNIARCHDDLVRRCSHGRIGQCTNERRSLRKSCVGNCVRDLRFRTQRPELTVGLRSAAVHMDRVR